MKYVVVFRIILIGCIIQLCSCKKENTSASNNIINKPKDSLIFKATTDTVFDLKNPFYSFIKSYHPKALNDKLMFLKEKDLDLDGQDETIIGFGADSDAGPFFEYIFVLKNDQGVIKEIKADFLGLKELITDISFEMFDGQKKPYLCLGIDEAPSAAGFSLYEMTDNRMTKFFVSGNVGKGLLEYADIMIDSNHDGQYDGYYQSVDYYRFTLDSYFNFENGAFKFKEKHYVMDDYPQEAEWVIEQYLCIRSLKFTDNASNKRLHEIYGNYTADKLSFNTDDWNAIYRGIVEDNEIKLDIKEVQDNIAEASFYYSDENNIHCQIKIELQIADNKWKITKIVAIDL